MLFELESLNNSDECHWIWMRFGGVHGECVVLLLCENELNRRGLRFGGNSKVYKCSLSWNRLITSVGVIGFG